MTAMTPMTDNASPLLTIVESLEPDRVVVKLIGLADSPSSVVLEREFLRLNALRAALVVFDLSQLTFISSLAIGLLARDSRDTAAKPCWKASPDLLQNRCSERE